MWCIKLSTAKLLVESPANLYGYRYRNSKDAEAVIFVSLSVITSILALAKPMFLGTINLAILLQFSTNLFSNNSLFKLHPPSLFWSKFLRSLNVFANDSISFLEFILDFMSLLSLNRLFCFPKHSFLWISSSANDSWLLCGIKSYFFVWMGVEVQFVFLEGTFIVWLDTLFPLFIAFQCCIMMI